MDRREFKAWRIWMRWSQETAAEMLGLSRRTVQLYESGKNPVPKVVELSCHALSKGVREYTGPT